MEKTALTSKFGIFFWSSLLLVIAQAVAYFVAFRQKELLETYNITPSNVSFAPALIYFVVAVGIIGLLLFFLPTLALRYLLKAIFTLFYMWGVLVALSFVLPFTVALVLAVALGLAGLFLARVWLHDLLLVITLAGVGAVYGVFFTPWTFMLLMLVIAVYDFLAVRFGFMQWMAGRFSQFETLPAFIIPRVWSAWNMSLKKAGFSELEKSIPEERQFSILGGGDVGFPLLLMSSVFFSYSFSSSLIIAAFSVLGLITAFWFQMTFVPGKAIPALPPISLWCLVGLAVVFFLVR